MSFCVIDGVAYTVQTNGTTENETQKSGQIRRAFDFTPRTSIRVEKRTWSLLLAPISPSAGATLRAAFALGATKVCSGEFADGATVTCWGVLKTAGYFQPNQVDGMFRVFQLDLFEA